MRDKQDMFYKDYLASPKWGVQRAKALLFAESRCQVCYNAARLDVHHRTYRNLGEEEPCDLIVLCRYCHHLFHSNGRLKGATTTPLQERLTVAKRRDKVGLIATGSHSNIDKKTISRPIPLYDPVVLLYQLKDDLSLEAIAYHLGAELHTVTEWMDNKKSPNRQHRKNAAKVYNYWKENGNMVGFQSHRNEEEK
tara:strand:- start:42 stop:623 length:582 start_codon:yes stop_codon:yes gene_type:complete